MSENLRIGVCDWSDFAVDAGFYPDDLPLEWRLGYFANEFESACLRLSALPVDADQCCEWLDSLPAGFELSFKVDTTRDLQRLDALPSLGNAGAGFLLLPPGVGEVDCSWPGRQLDMSHAVWRPGNEQSAPCALLPHADDPKLCRQWIECWLDLSKHDSTAHTLWVEAKSVNAGRLEALRQLVEMMGL